MARDADVRLAALEAWCAELAPLDQPAAEKVVGAARHDQALAHRKLLEAMAADRYLEVLRSLEAIAYRSQVVPGALWQYLDLPAATAMAHLGAAQWGSLRRTVKRLGGTPCDEGLHRVRIQAKRLRYIAEAAAQVVRPASSGRAAAATALMATELQDVLGQLHDAVAHEQWLRDLAARGVPRPTAPPGQDSTRADGTATATDSTQVALVAGQLVAASRSTAATCRGSWQH
ncbi:MAG: CHAD domain-containing protein, partial [Actinobacteria bacterium]|nr:CHAD domain-containing protein [Actinomycetota bacterium]